MRAPVRTSGFALALAVALFAASPSPAAEPVKEPATGGLTPAVVVPPAAAAPAAPAPAAAPAAAPTAVPATAPIVPPPFTAPPPSAPVKKEDSTRWGIAARYGYFGVPDAIADELFVQHPKVEGTMYGGEIRYHGDGGGRGVASIGLAVDTGTTKTDGIWQAERTDPPKAASGEIDVLAITVTGYWSILPSWPVHPYVGIGLGVAHIKGSYQNDEDRVEVDYWVPAVNLPVGLAVEFGEHFQVSAEARFIDGIAVNGVAQVRF